MKKGFSTVLGVVIVLLIGAVGFVLWQQYANKNMEPQKGDMANWKTYRNEKYGFEVKYPPSWMLFGDLVRGKGDTMVEDPAIAKLNEGVSRGENLQDRELWFQPLVYATLTKTVKEVCDEMKKFNPGLPDSCDPREPTQEEFQSEQKQLESAPIGTTLPISHASSGGKVTMVAGQKGMRTIYFDPTGGLYSASFTTYAKNGDRITLDVSLPGIAQGKIEEATQDPRNIIFGQILSTFKFIK